MFPFFMAQTLTYLILICPGSILYRLILIAPLLYYLIKSPIAVLLGTSWQLSNLTSNPASLSHPTSFTMNPIITLKCDPKFWFLCENNQPNILITYITSTQLGTLAESLRNFVEQRCLSWDKEWGKLIFSIIMGGKPSDELKSLYKNLGFLHVLVISGSQFALLSRWFELTLSKPFKTLYALTALNWRHYRHICLMLDIVLQFTLFTYLLACNTTAPCQRAFLEHAYHTAKKWLIKPEAQVSRTVVMRTQLLLFPQTFFTLSNLLSWGAVAALRAFSASKSLAQQIRTSITIQLLSLALFSRVSLSALILDFFVAPLWDLLLLGAVLIILLPSNPMDSYVKESLELIHQALYQLDSLQAQVFGSSMLTLKPGMINFGRIFAALIFLGIIFRFRQAKPACEARY